MNRIVCETFNKRDPEGAGKVLHINHGRIHGNKFPMLEVVMEKEESAYRIRKAFVAAKKNGRELGKVHVANCVTLATRVRVDILHAIANKF